MTDADMPMPKKGKAPPPPPPADGETPPEVEPVEDAADTEALQAYADTLSPSACKQLMSILQAKLGADEGAEKLTMADFAAPDA